MPIRIQRKRTRGYYDCRISKPKRRGMDWTETNYRYAVSLMRSLMRLPQARGQIGIIRFREKGQIGSIRTWNKLPIVFSVRWEDD